MNSSLVTFGFLPVIVFVLVDSMWGKPRALVSALAAGGAQMLILAGRGGAFDWLGFAGFALLVAMVAASMRARDDFYFKIHGPLFNILCALALLSGWFVFHKALVLQFVDREVGIDKLAATDPRLGVDTVYEIFRVLSYQLPWWMMMHAAATIHAAANRGKWGWAFFRVPGFLIMLMLAGIVAEITVFLDRAPK